MTADDELADHTGNAEQQDAEHVDDDEHGATVLTRHIREAPYIAQTYGRARRGQDNTKFTTETGSLEFCHLIICHNSVCKNTKISEK